MSDRINSPIEYVRGGLIVSCQAEGDDPFNRPEYVALFARAAQMGGARGIRAREVENIRSICQAVDLPVIGITKGEFPDGSVLITPDFSDAEAVLNAGARVVAVDATSRRRPNGLTGPEFIARLKQHCNSPVMADVSTLDEGIAAADAGADAVGSTLSGYTPYTRAGLDEEPDWKLLQALSSALRIPVIAEGRISSPEQARRALEMGAFAVVVGTVITRPRLTVGKYVQALRSPYVDDD